jgi:L-threonylcarbamoyladenylate synthase
MIGQSLNKAKKFLVSGELVAIPTETVYGLAGNALDENSVAKIFEAKNRPSFDPLIVHSYSTEQAKKYVQNFPQWAEKLAEIYWPGPLTLLLTRNQLIPDIVTSGSDLVGIRVPRNPLTLALLQQLPFPLAAPSANPFGYVSPTTAQHVADQLENKISYILNGGACKVGVESTIVGEKNGTVCIFRTGGISVEDIENTLKTKVEIVQSTSNPMAPGMLESHYSPHKPLYIGNIQKLIDEFSDKKLGVISFSKNYSKRAEKSLVLSKKEDLKEAACALFKALRQMDKNDVEIILTEIFPDIGIGKAINDRLKRAANKRK